MKNDILPACDACGIFGANPLAPEHILHAFRPLNQIDGAAQVADALLAPLASAMPGFEVRVDIALKGHWRGGNWTTSSGHLCGNFTGSLFGIPATQRIAHIRFGCFQRWQEHEVVETILLLDLPGLMMQAGVWPLASPMGPFWMAPGPHELNGVWPTSGDGAASLGVVEAMINGLMKFDGQLKTMNMRDFWVPDFWWYGPGPIGSFRGFPDYERGHAGPFLTAFPDRVGGNHRARLGDGDFIASTGWPSITATHKGSGWLGIAATDKAITMRVMDFWRTRGGLLAENWVMIDIPDLLFQIGIDVFDRS